MQKYPSLVTLKLPTEVVKVAREQAEADDRTFSDYVRRIIIAGVKQAAAGAAHADHAHDAAR